MKKFAICLLLVCAVLLMVFCLPKEKQRHEYLRLHIRANSNLKVDQDVKYEIKDKVVEFLTPLFCEVDSKNEAISLVEKTKKDLVLCCENVLNKKGFDYSVNIKINNEYFPTRKYDNTTLEAGYYDAVIIELGQAKGDNWWCVMYPPLCFVNKNKNGTQIKFESKIKNWIKSIFN